MFEKLFEIKQLKPHTQKSAAIKDQPNIVAMQYQKHIVKYGVQGNQRYIILVIHLKYIYPSKFNTCIYKVFIM